MSASTTDPLYQREAQGMRFWLKVWRDCEQHLAGLRRELDAPNDDGTPQDEWDEYIERCRANVPLYEHECARAQANAIGWAAK